MQTPGNAGRFGALGGTRTPDLLLRRQLLYPVELQAHIMERVMGIEPTRPAWKAGILPLNYTRRTVVFYHKRKTLSRNSYDIFPCTVKIASHFRSFHCFCFFLFLSLVFWGMQQQIPVRKPLAHHRVSAFLRIHPAFPRRS